MKYRSLKWWLSAIAFQARIILRIRNIKIFFGLEEKFTPADKITMYVIKHGQELYDILVSKYPDYSWTKKYVKRDLAYLIPEFVNLYSCVKFGLTAFWSKSVDIEDCCNLLDTGYPISTVIWISYKEEKVRHSILLIGYNPKKRVFYAHDPLGDHFSNYKIFYGANLEFSFDYMRKINIGNPIPHFSPRVRSRELKSLSNMKFIPTEAKVRKRQCVVRVQQDIRIN